MDVRRPVSFIVACAIGAGCSSTYAPRPGPRVAVIQQNGNPAYVRDGKVYEGGIFGGEIVEAVQGNPEAESHARAYKNGMIGGFLATIGGAVSFVSGATLLAVGSASDGQGRNNATEQTAGGLLLAGGIGAYIAGLILMLNAQPRMWDAINVYNDGIPMGMPYGYPPPGAYPYPPPGSWLPPSSGAPPIPASTAPAPTAPSTTAPPSTPAPAPPRAR